MSKFHVYVKGQNVITITAKKKCEAVRKASDWITSVAGSGIQFTVRKAGPVYARSQLGPNCRTRHNNGGAKHGV